MDGNTSIWSSDNYNPVEYQVMCKKVKRRIWTTIFR